MTGAYPPSAGWERLIPEVIMPVKTPKPTPPAPGGGSEEVD
jgi:hypothetical protein